MLTSALKRRKPENPEEAAPWLSILAGDKDKAIASLASKLIKQWGIDAGALLVEKTEVKGLWQKTPPVWQVPPFKQFSIQRDSRGMIIPEELTELASKISKYSFYNFTTVHDITAERFLAIANAIAYEDPEAVRSGLAGLRSDGNWSSLPSFLLCWIEGRKPIWGFDNKERTKDSLDARDYMITVNLGKQPCVLSTPSKDDLSITVSDLVSRLALYKKTNANVLEADLFLALTRLDVKTKTNEDTAALQKLDMPVFLQSGEKMYVTAGEAVYTYLDTPVREPSLEDSKNWRPNPGPAYERKEFNGKAFSEAFFFGSASFRGFPNRFTGFQKELYSIFPLWGDAALRAVSIKWDTEFYHEKGLVLRQVARRAAPLPPGAAINFLAAQRSSTSDAAEDSSLAVREAWERGLLRPGVADVALLDWSDSPPQKLVALVSALEDIASGGMLSVVWPVLDDLISVSLKAPKLLAGTLELAGLIETFLPEAQFAVENGLAGKNSLDLPGIRKLAERGGSSLAVSIAQKIILRLSDFSR